MLTNATTIFTTGSINRLYIIYITGVGTYNRLLYTTGHPLGLKALEDDLKDPQVGKHSFALVSHLPKMLLGVITRG